MSVNNPFTTMGTGTITGNSGSYLTTTLGNWTSDLTWHTNTISTPLKVNGDAEIDGDLKVKGKSLTEAIERIEERLAILHPNKDLEERWEELKELGKRYQELERDIMEKEKIWEKLQK